MPQDLAKIKRNVAKMVSQNAPEEDIDSYISSEGVTIDQVRAFKEQSSKSKGGGYDQFDPLSIATKVPLAIMGVQEKWKQSQQQLQESGTKLPGFVGQFTPMPKGTEFQVQDLNKLAAGSMNMFNAGMRSMSVPLATFQGTPVQTLMDVGMIPGNVASWVGKQVLPKMSPELEEAYNEAAPVLLSPPAWMGISKIGRMAKPVAAASAEKARARTATKIGSLIGAGENIGKARRAGQYMVEEKIPVAAKAYERTPQGLVPVSKGAKMARERVQQLNEELNQKIFDPATAEGVTFETKPIYDAAIQLYEKTKAEFLPNKTLLRGMERELQLLKETIEKNNGKLTPRQVQDFKVRNNALLSEIYKKRDRGTLSERQEARESILLESNSQLRQMLENFDPQVKGTNWTEGAGLDVTKALDKYLEYRMSKDPAMVRGSGITGAAMGRGRLATLFFASELALFRPFRIAYNKLLNRMATKISGVESEFTRSIK